MPEPDSTSYLSHIRAFSVNARRFLAAGALWSLGQALLHLTRNLYWKESGWTEAGIGTLLSASQLGTVLCTIPAAILIDRWRSKPLLVLSVFATMAANVGQVLCQSRGAVLASSFAAGAGSAVFLVASAPFFARHSTPRERTHLFGVSIGLAALANVLGAFSVRLLEPWLGHGAEALRTMMLCGAAGGVLAVAPLALLRETPRPEVPRGLRQLLFARDWGLMLRLCAPDMLIGLGAGLTIPFINLYFQGRFGKSAGDISVYYAASHAMNMTGFLLAPVFSQRFGKVAVIAGSQLLSIPFFAFMAFTGSLPVAVAAFLLRSLLMNMAQPVNAAFVMERAAEDQQAVMNSFKQLSWNGSWTVSALLGGWLIHGTAVGRDGYTLPMLLTIGCYLSGTTLFLALWARRTAPPDSPRTPNAPALPAITSTGPGD
ncbi:MAG: MFS transporter [Candidatus Brocadiae bacterium]|nr:MFS transporter [Candidatus Brocadiia bacterium]